MIPVIMITGDESKEMDSLRAGVDDYITKPFDETILRLRVKSILDRVSRYTPASI